MKNVKFLFSLLLLSSLSYAQETVRKINRLQNGDKEEFYVLRSDKKIMHGAYEKKGSFSHVTGNYNNGLKDGTWTEFLPGDKLRSVGAYSKNERVGLWKFYTWEGVLEQEFDFTKRELIYDRLLENMKARKFNVINGADTINTFLERPPVYITGKTRMQSALTKGTSPAQVFRLGMVSGNVIIGFTIDTTGQARDHKIISGINKACDAEALRMVKQLPPNWLPAKLNGELVEVQHTITIDFKNNL